MDILDWLQNNVMPNAAGDASRSIEPQVSQYRSANGRLDPNAVTSAVPEEVRPEANMMLKMGDMRRESLQSYKPEPLSWNKWLGGALQEISIPVAYARGNQHYATMAYPNTILKQQMARENAYADRAAAANLDITDQTATGIGNAAVEYTTERRKRRQAAKEMVAKSIAAAGARGPQAAAQAAQMGSNYLRSLGLNEDADAIGRMAPAAPMSPAATPGEPSGVPGTTVTPPSPSPAPQGQPQAMPQASDPGVMGSLSGPASGVPLSPKRQLAELVAPYNEEAAKSLLKEAEAEEAPGLEGAKEEAKKRSENRVKLEVEQPDAQKSLATTFDTLDGVEQTVDALLSPDGQVLSDGAASNVGGVWDTYMPNWPGGEAANAGAKIKKLKDNIGVMVLNAMREASKTGGAVGNVTEKEWPILQSQLAALDPNMSDEEFASSLKEIKRRVSAMRQNAAMAYDNTYGTDIGRRLSTAEQERAAAQAKAQSPVKLDESKTAAIRDRYAAADDATKQSILESLQRRGIDPQTILTPSTPKAVPPNPKFRNPRGL